MTSETYDELLMEQMTGEGGDQAQSLLTAPAEPLLASASPDVRGWFRRLQMAALAAAQRIRRIYSSRPRWQRRVIHVLACAAVLPAILVGTAFHHLYLDRANLPDIEPFFRFEFSTIGHVYDVRGEPLIELAREYRRITSYDEIPPIVRDAIIATEDKNFFSHNGLDYSRIPHVLAKARVGSLVARVVRPARQGEARPPAVFPQGGSTITQQLVRGHFLRELTAHEGGRQLRHRGRLPRALSYVAGARAVNKLFRKLEEIRLTLWVEREMKKRFGSKRRAKEEILARYASLIYMGNGRYGIAAAAEYYFGKPLAAFIADDADKAALLASIAKSPRHYAPTAADTARVVRRRNQTLVLMARNGFISRDQSKGAQQRPMQAAALNGQMLQAPAVMENVLDELKGHRGDLGIEGLLLGRIQVYSTVDRRVQQIVNEGLEHGLQLYEKRRPAGKGLIQGSVVVLRNRDASILAEAGGRSFYKLRSNSHSDFNRVTKSLRQPGSAMKPLVYLAAFRQGEFNLDTVVPDEPISVPNGETPKWISNYDGQFKGMIPLRKALAESRNAVAIWITEQIGIDSVLRTSRKLGIQTTLQRYATTALGASEVNLLELANAYRSMASGIVAQPYVIRRIVHQLGGVVADEEPARFPIGVDDDALALIQEGLRGVVRLPGGTAHSLASRGFPIAIMGKTGTTNDFRDALFVGSTYGPEGITVAVRIGFDDNRSLGSGETGGRVALPVFKQIMLRVYGEKLAGPVPRFPPQMEQRINVYLQGEPAEIAAAPDASPAVLSKLRAASVPIYPSLK